MSGAHGGLGPRGVAVGEAVVSVAIAAVVALLAAAGTAAWATAGHGYWTDGYYRVLVDAVRVRFDLWAAGTAAGALVLVTGLHLLGRRRAPSPRVVRAAVLILGVVVVLRAAIAADAWRASRGPNVLLISIDTLRADRLGTYGATLPTSPTIDRRLAAEGVLFERCYSQSPKTTPSHMTLLTSLYPPVHGIELWEGDAPGAVLNPTVRTLAEVLKNAGYATAAFTGGVHVHRSRGFDHGFDVYKHGRQLERALPWIAAHRGRRFFVFYHTYAVHDPYLPPESLERLFAPDYDGPLRETVARLRAGIAGGWDAAHRVFWSGVDPHAARDVGYVSALYAAGVRHMDDTTVAPLLDALDRLGIARDTLVVFTSDHGEAFAEHGVFLHDDLYAETLHVPLILRFPGRVPAGARRVEPVRLVDVMPTVLELLDIPAPAALQGRSLVPLLGRSAPVDGDGAGVPSDFSNERAHRVFQSLRSGPLTYIRDGSSERLFDTASDPGEQRDLAAERAPVVATMRERLGRWSADCAPLAARFGPRGAGVTPGADTLRQMRALGYVE